MNGKAKTINIRRQNAKQAILTSVLAMAVSLILGAILLAVCGYSPIESYIAIFGSSLGTVKGFALSLSQATPLLFTGMAFAIAYRVRMINTGAEGQLYVGAMAAALVGAYVTGLPSVVHVPLCLLAAALAGGLVAGLVAFLKNRFGASEIILTLMLNEIRQARLKKAVQTILYAPHFISTVVMVGILVNMLSPSIGVVNTLRARLGLERIYFMTQPSSFRHLYVW